jgi:hypothetical protein
VTGHEGPPHGEYVMGVNFAALTQGFVDVNRLPRVAMPHLQTYHAAVGEYICISCLLSYKRHIIVKLFGKGNARVAGLCAAAARLELVNAPVAPILKKYGSSLGEQLGGNVRKTDEISFDNDFRCVSLAQA